MGTSRKDIKEWFEHGVEQKATHLLIICDTYDWEDYPSYAYSLEQAKKSFNSPGEMQRIMEVYNLSIDMDKQLNEHRSMNW